MAALVQSYPQQSGTVTMLQTRPSSASGILPAGQAQGQQYGVSQAQRNSFYGASGPVGGQAVYRGTSGPIQPYAFTSTPSLHANGQWQHGAGFRSSSTSAVPTVHSFETTNAAARPRYPASVSMSHLPGNFNGGYAMVGSRDDSSLPAVGGRRNPAAPRPQSTHFGGMTGTGTATAVTFTQATPIKVSPDRYRRPAPRPTDSAVSSSQARPQISAQPSGSGMAGVGHLYNGHAQSEQRPSNAHSRAASAYVGRPTSLYSLGNSSPSADDLQLGRQQAQDDLKRLRRRSMPALDSIDFSQPQGLGDLKEQLQFTQAPKTDRDSLPSRSGSPANVRSGSPANGSGQLTVPGLNNRVHIRTASSDSVASSRSSASRPSSASRNPVITAPTGNPSASASKPDQSAASNGKDHPRLVNIPPRSSSSDAPKNVPVPSPLSRPMTMESASEAATTKNGGGHVPSPAKAPASPRVPEPLSPAAQQLAAISQKTGKPKSKTSRLRRAFSFGSAAEFRKAAIPEDSAVDTPTKLHKDPSSDELYDAEQARIAEQQEAAGIGHSIYAGAKIFAASNDNISISSTASSASIMIRKMGRGMKKGTRSLVGLFRPKSIIGAPASEAQPSEASQAAVSMITVEAERERVNVNADPHTQNGGGTGFPRLERNSIDASKAPNAVSDGTSDSDSATRRSIVGGDKERAEVLAAVRKGILKHRGASNSPPQGHATILVPNAPAMTDSPNSSAPSTPNDDIQGHKRSTSVAIGSEDYFMTALRLRQDTRSAPVTPQNGTPTSTLRRNATFSPRIIFYDTWPSGEYDRRGEISTCNRLTPMLAQQIKEELNSFKMEMEVHETSKIYTHFF